MQIDFNTRSQIRKRNRHNFLLTFFFDPPHYEYKEVNGFILVRYHNRVSDKWEVAIYTPEAFKRSEDYKNKEVDNRQHGRD